VSQQRTNEFLLTFDINHRPVPRYSRVDPVEFVTASSS